MISFACTCGKTYQLPDRHAGREVRCNQCHKTLIVPQESQTEAVVPKDDQATKPAEAEATPVEPKKSLPVLPIAVAAVVALVVGVALGKIVFHPPVKLDNETIRALAPDPAPVEVAAAPEAPVSAPVLALKDWRVDDTGTAFTVKTLDGAKATLSPDADPVAAAKAEGGGNVLDVVADAVKTEDEKAGDGTKHDKSFRIDSESREELRLIWPGNGSLGLSGEGVKEFRFSLYVPVKPNAVFKPGKPEGTDRILALSSIRLRLVADNGVIEYAPADNDKLVHLVERSRSDWLPVVVPIGGDENWKRSDFGLAGPLVIDRIELRVKPTGGGVTFWVDNLSVVE